MTVLDPPSIPALEPIRPRPTPFKRSVECPTVETPIRAAERIIAQVNSCYCGHHRDQHRTRMVRVEGQLALVHTACLAPTTGMDGTVYVDQCECPGYRETDEAFDFKRRVAHELRNLP